MSTDADQQPERASKLAAIGRQLRPVAPVLMVTAFAIYGQIGYGLEKYSRPDTPFLLALVIAIGAAVTVESIANYVQWHAHDARLLGATATAARLRRASYLIALAVAGVNYAHFAGPGLSPTPGAIVFGLFSASQPWLWGLHTRRAQHKQLLREGHADSAGAVFSAERFRAFPLRTIAARRWSIDHNVTDPKTAWEGYRQERAARAGAPTPEQRIALLMAVARLAAARPALKPKLAPVKAVAAAVLPQVEVKAHAARAKPVVKSLVERSTPERVVFSSALVGPPKRIEPTELLANPPQVALELVKKGLGWPGLKSELLEEHLLEISEYGAREFIKKYRTSGNQVATS